MNENAQPCAEVLGHSVTLVPRVVCVTSSRKTLSPEPLRFLSLLRIPLWWPWLCHLSSPRVALARHRPRSRRLPLPSAVRHRHYLPRPSRRLFPSGLAPFRGLRPLPPASAGSAARSPREVSRGGGGGGGGSSFYPVPPPPLPPPPPRAAPSWGTTPVSAATAASRPGAAGARAGLRHSRHRQLRGRGLAAPARPAVARAVFGIPRRAGDRPCARPPGPAWARCAPVAGGPAPVAAAARLGPGPARGRGRRRGRAQLLCAERSHCAPNWPSD